MKNNSTQKISFAKRIIFSTISILFILLIIECFFSIYDYFSPSPTEISEIEKEFNFTKPFQSLHELKPSSKVLYGLRPNAFAQFKLNRKDFVDYKINSKGFRDKEFLTEKPENVVRIAVLGDSITFGFEVPLERTYPKVLENMLNQNRNRQVEVLNFGVGGYNTYNELELLQETVIKYKPDIVILGFCMNDIANPYADFTPHTVESLGNLPLDAIPNPVTMIKPVQTKGLLKELLKYSHALQHIQKLATSIKSKKNNSNNPNSINLAYKDALESFAKTDSIERKWLLNKLLKMKKVCEDNGAKFFVTIFPLYYQLDNRYAFSESRILIREFCQNNSIPNVDLHKIFQDYSIDTKKEIYSDVVHPNEIGHQLTSQAILEELKAILPSFSRSDEK